MSKQQERSLALLAMIVMIVAGIYLEKLEMSFVPSIALKVLAMVAVFTIGGAALHATRVPKNDP